MIRRLLDQLEALKARSPAPWRQLCAQLPYSSLMRWRRRRRRALPVW